MVLDAVEATALGIKGAEPRGVLVGLPRKLGGSGTPGNPAESGKVLGGIGRTLTRDCLAQRHIGREQIHVGKGRALIQVRFRFTSRGHGSPPPMMFQAYRAGAPPEIKTRAPAKGAPK
jgi:hypothetical protein